MSGGNKRSQSEESEMIDLKRIKTEDQKIIWEWENDGQVWTKFTINISKDIETAFKSGLSKMKLTINDIKFDIIFERMVQRNSKTFWERRIRANTLDQDGGLSGTYEREGDDRTWSLYNHSIQRLFYAANLYKLSKVSFPERGQKYTVDLEQMVQIDINSKVKRNIRIAGESDKENDGKNSQTVVNGGRKKPSTRRTIQEEKEEEDIGLEEEIAKKLQGSSKSSSKDSKNKTKVKTEDSKEVIHSISFKGKVPVDVECFAREKYHIYSEGSTVYDAMLNQTNLKNNNNKFYLMQILQTNAKKSFAVWFRWGRVGMVGQSNLTNCGADLEEAKEMFCKKFFDKTKNEFSDRKKFKKVQGKYDLLFMDYNSTANDEADGPSKPKKETKVPESKLDKKLQVLIESLCNVKEMEQAVLEMKYDTKKAPLGKLTKDQIKAGYKALQKIDQCLTKKESGDKLIKACDAFYTRVPHCFGMQRPPVIRTKSELKLKIELLEILGDIEIAMKVINDGANSMLNPIDQHYKDLNCALTPVSHDSEEFKLVDLYTQNTHAKTHNQYTMEVVDVFVCYDSRQDEKFNDVGNRKLLWHGSRLTNWFGILSQGLRIAPPEAPVTGYMFGKGIYFADMSSKSANYCYPTRSKNTGFVLLCEVSLGKTNDILVADYEAAKLPVGCHSVKGLGKIAPDETKDITLSDGLIVPVGTACETAVVNPDGYTLNYNEYVVYDTSQVKSRYLVQLKFHFK